MACSWMPRLRLLPLLHLLLLQLYTTTVVGSSSPINIPFNGEDDQISPDLDGPWPTIPVYYDAADGGTQRLDCYLTLWLESIFVSPQTCAASPSPALSTPSSNHSSQVLCSDGLELPRFYSNNATSNNESVPATIDLTEVRQTLINADFQEQTYENQDLVRLLHTNGSCYQAYDNLTFGSHLAVPDVPFLVGYNLTTSFSNTSATLPLLTSVISLSGGGGDGYLNYTSNNILTTLYQSGQIPSKSFGLHMGSVKPFVPGSLWLGGYDGHRLADDVYVYSNNTIGQDGLLITSVKIGVEQGFLPLQSLLAPNGSFVQGPYSIEPTAYTNSYYRTSPVAIEPGVPYMYLPPQMCDSLASYLDLEYDSTRNLYLWRRPASDPLFQSPAYLEISFGIRNTSNFENPLKQYVSVKIPFALLQNTFHATTTAPNGTTIPPSRYFPCSPIDPSYYNGREWEKYPTLGRAFLQTAMFGMNFHTGQQWLAQAPGPTRMGAADVVPIMPDTLLASTNVTVEPYAWTNTWSGALPAWTVNTDGTILDLNGQNRGGLSIGEKIGIGLGVPFGLFALIILILFAVRRWRSSRQKWQRIKREMAEEDELARKIEREELEKERRRVADSSSAHGSSSSIADQWDLPQVGVIHQIPRKPVASFAYSDEIPSLTS